MPDPLASIKPESLNAALKGFYTPPKPGGSVVSGTDLIALLETLPALSVGEHVDPILVQMQKHHRGTSFLPEDHALLAFVDDSIGQILHQTDLDFKLESFVRDLAPFIAATALRDGVKAITQEQPVYNVIDTLMRECIGWSEDLGILGDQFMEKIEVPVRLLIKGKSSVAECQAELGKFFGKEAPIFAKMEERLCASELDVLAGQKGKYFAAELLNQKMAGKGLPLFIIFMLQGSWYEFLQKVFVTYGLKSQEWSSISKLTEALIWCLQAQKDQEKHQALMASLPEQVKAFCAKLSFDTAPYESCMADVEAEFDLIREGNPSDPCDFELMEVDTSAVDGNREIDREVLKQIERFKEGQWFLYDDKQESSEKIARIKLILNWHDTERLLFTNHNRRKVLHMSYAELAGYISSETVSLLSPRAPAHEITHAHLLTVIKGIQQQKKIEVGVEEEVERKQVSQQFLTKRKEALKQALEAHREEARVKQERAMVLRQKAARKLEAATEAVKALNLDAWVKLPIMEGTLTPCRLVAIIPASDKYIFANRGGIKVAEYTGGQLSHMIVTENSEILDTGAEFQSVLASVVTGLREDKGKSYEELTGDTA
ncbi:MAG: DUF1631 family protein [Pseudomonadales bacterium]